MFPLIFFSLIVTVSAKSYGCPTNVTCIEKETCCQTDTGLWACCPIEDGICCNDGLHCCQKGQTCSPDGSCLSPSNQTNPAIPLRIRFTDVNTVQCSDGSACPDGSTCCQLSSGQYGCCPIVDAICCSDHIHCCPQGYACDVEHSRCRRKFEETNDVPCPGGSSDCPDGETCCQLESGDYGCCPLPNAVCCSDHLHCCPHGYTCNVEKGQCEENLSIPWFKKTPSIQRHQKMIDIKVNDGEEEKDLIELTESEKASTQLICPDGLSLCPSTSTCCVTPNQSWGCCPIEKAVCCSDHVHCCPTHYNCDLHTYKCDHPLFGSIPILKKVPSTKLSKKLIPSDQSFSTIQCPDEKSYCPEETTCCELVDGSYGCCPYDQATCCSDKIHCCGNGYSCDSSGNRCTPHLNGINQTIISSEKKMISSKKRNEKVEGYYRLSPIEDQTCPDGKTKCSPTTTCCPNNSNGETTYSCCPYPKGVCCGNNGSVCCPNNYMCDEKALSCQLNDMNFDFIRERRSDNDFNQCGSSDVGCSADQTCCRTYGSSDGEFACCAFPDAQCCEDGRHCCPPGTRCDVHSNGCVQNY